MKTMENLVLPEAFFSGRLTPANQYGNLSAEDRLAIMEIATRFEWAFDAQNFDALAEILTDDVVIDHVFGYVAGKQEAIPFLQKVIPAFGIRHQMTNPVIYRADNGNICVLSYLLVVEVARQNGDTQGLPRIAGHALITDTVRQEGRQWKLAQRTFEQMSIPSDYKLDDGVRRRLESTSVGRPRVAAAELS